MQPIEISSLICFCLFPLKGGPGASSLYGLFVENGPLQVTKDLQVFQRNHTWNKDFAILYFDQVWIGLSLICWCIHLLLSLQPVGTGFSFTEADAGYAKNEVTDH